MKRSLLQTEKKCYVCGRTDSLQLHHCIYGTANRRLSDDDGLVIWLCMPHHTGQNGVHFNKELDTKIKKASQEAWQEKYGTIEDFIARYGKSYL